MKCGYIGRNPICWYRVMIWEFGILVKADSRAAARYEAWLNINDAYPMSFKEFILKSRVLRVR